MRSEIYAGDFLIEEKHRTIKRLVEMGCTFKNYVSMRYVLRELISSRHIELCAMEPNMIEIGYFINDEFVKREDASSVLSAMEDCELEHYLNMIFLDPNSLIIRLSKACDKLYSDYNSNKRFVNKCH